MAPSLSQAVLNDTRDWNDDSMSTMGETSYSSFLHNFDAVDQELNSPISVAKFGSDNLQRSESLRLAEEDEALLFDLSNLHTTKHRMNLVSPKDDASQVEPAQPLRKTPSKKFSFQRIVPRRRVSSRAADELVNDENEDQEETCISLSPQKAGSVKRDYSTPEKRKGHRDGLLSRCFSSSKELTTPGSTRTPLKRGIQRFLSSELPAAPLEQNTPPVTTKQSKGGNKKVDLSRRPPVPKRSASTSAKEHDIVFSPLRRTPGISKSKVALSKNATDELKASLSSEPQRGSITKAKSCSVASPSSARSIDDFCRAYNEIMGIDESDDDISIGW